MGQASTIMETGSAFPGPGQVPNGLCIPCAPSVSGLAHMGHVGQLSRQLPGTGEWIRGIWAVLKADITETLSLRKTKKSHMGRKKITGSQLGK